MSDTKEVVIRAENVRTYFPVRDTLGRVVNQVKAVDGISMEVHKGEIYGLVGESGCGKSTFGRTLIRLLEPTDGKLELLGQDVTHTSMKALRPFRSKVQMIFQDPYTSLNPRKRVGEILMEVLQIHGEKDRDKCMSIAMETLHKVGLRPEHFYRYPHEFSGGQRQRVGIARALSYVFIAHDMSVVRYISDRIGVMYLGHLVEEAPTDELFAHPMHPYTEALLSAVPDTNPHATAHRIHLQGEIPSPIDPPKGCVFHTRCPYATEACGQIAPQMRQVAPGHRTACLKYDMPEAMKV